ncbi:sulfurtransferase TusA family protein [Marinihelvus fidelis]|uniref:Sulfurtransferase TusA family protein n=1 Tax=Marinihelvus fidelis TaxID=2613842 RepID=A0A5N0TAY1_9GAMM|nr:sulfurtransferase TusA family protein [Marinihelvus fidelis]KAA9131911.1 sulfurtransferase TusA family protein [Marinihelvus fidelis]
MTSERQASTPLRIDARDLLCPEPVRQAELAARQVGPGTLLLIEVTDPAAPLDLEAWCLRRGHTWVEARGQANGSTTLSIRTGSKDSTP